MMRDTDIQNFTEEDIERAVSTMKAGGIILYPTDTVWGIGCDATNKEAVAKIYLLKQRSDSKALITLLNKVEFIERYADIPEVAYQLLEVAVEPVTIVYDGARGVANNLIADDGSIAIRVTHEQISSELCRRLRRPVVSTSANISGTPTPRNFKEIDMAIIEGVDYAMKSRRDDMSTPKSSTILRLRPNGEVTILRK